MLSKEFIEFVHGGAQRAGKNHAEFARLREELCNLQTEKAAWESKQAGPRIMCVELHDDATNEWKKRSLLSFHQGGDESIGMALDINALLNEKYGDYCIYFSVDKGDENE